MAAQTQLCTEQSHAHQAPDIARLIFVALGIAMFVWGYRENASGVASTRGGWPVYGPDAHAIGWLKMLAGAAFILIAGNGGRVSTK